MHSPDRVVHTSWTSRRGGGVSRPPYDDLNLGDHVGDDPTAVARNRAAVAAALGVERVVWMDQVHGDGVAVVDDRTPSPVAGVDALVTTAPGVALGVLVADCVPVLMTTAGGAVAAVHVGRRGLQAGVALRALEALRALDDEPVTAMIGPAVCGACYEVPPDLQDEVCAVVPEARSTTRAGTPALDLRRGVAAQLAVAGARARVLGGGSRLCTFEDELLFSYRRDGTTGRFAGLVVALPA